MACLSFRKPLKKALFCAPESGHLGAACRAAQHRDKGDHKKLAKIMAGVAGAGIRDIFQRGQENLHEGGRAPGRESPIQNRSRRHPQGQMLTPSVPNAIPLPCNPGRFAGRMPNSWSALSARRGPVKERCRVRWQHIQFTGRDNDLRPAGWPERQSSDTRCALLKPPQARTSASDGSPQRIDRRLWAEHDAASAKWLDNQRPA